MTRRELLAAGVAALVPVPVAAVTTPAPAPRVPRAIVDALPAPPRFLRYNQDTKTWTVVSGFDLVPGDVFYITDLGHVGCVTYNNTEAQEVHSRPPEPGLVWMPPPQSNV